MSNSLTLGEPGQSALLAFLQVLRKEGESVQKVLERFADLYDPKYLWGLIKAGKPLPLEVELRLKHEAYFGTFPDDKFFAPGDTELPMIRSAVIGLDATGLDAPLAHIEALLKACREDDHARRAGLLYCKSVAQFRRLKDGSVKCWHLIETSKALLREVDACEAIRPQLAVVARANHEAFRWQKLVMAKKAKGVELLDICEAGRLACLDGADKVPAWINAFRDATEYTAMLVSLGQRAMEKELDTALRRLVGKFNGQPANHVLHLLHEVEDRALHEIRQREIYKKLEALTQRDRTGAVGRINFSDFPKE
ncbi:hypothetical protein [Variovorax sp. J31P207]|uniref:hypothetical protein n=1 Tax=Variovorax sp. J31P207 TaxID=3053510 RepID=UPI0025772387|nr:hypothetical protein [Variovorax sp. J31P207]MDM0071629.1 hypothetical protein [Variovorax sp. J31P207]